VPAHRLPKSLRIQTHVNGEERQNATIEDLIFSVPILVKTLSEAQTLQPGDVVATGTPAGVGIGKKPPLFLKPGDKIEVSVTGLGVLENVISEFGAKNQTIERVAKSTHIPVANLSKTLGGIGLTSINSKLLHYRHVGDATGPQVIFVHGLGGSSEFFSPLISSLALDKTHSIHLMDLEGHGLSPTSAASSISISSYASDFAALAKQLNLSGATVIAHSMGCFVALTLALQHPELVSKLILLGPPPNPLPGAAQTALMARAFLVRSSGMVAVVDTSIMDGTSVKSKTDNPIGVAACRMSLLGQDPEGYAKGCTALANVSQALPVQHIKAQTLIVTGDEDKVSPPHVCEKYASDIVGAKVHILPQVGHWHNFEDVAGVAMAVGPFLS
jgi:pimeloyl-ACP methyl ester carboxylesterase